MSCTQAMCQSPQLAFLELQEKEMGEEWTPVGRLDTKMIKMCHSNFFDEKVLLVSTDFFKSISLKFANL